MAVSKAQKFLSFVLLLTAVWMFWILKIESFPTDFHILIYTLPFWVAVVVGVYAVMNVAYHMLVFRECPEAHKELMKEIKEAKADLAKKGIKVQPAK